MKRLASVILILVLLVCTAGCSQIRIPKNELAAMTYYENGNTEGVSKPLTVEESENLRRILKDAKHNAGIGGCAYDKERILVFGDREFMFADDGCLTMMDVENEKYYEVDKEDWEYIMQLFVQYSIEK